MFRQVYRFVRDQLGLDPVRTYRALRSLPRYWSSLRLFRQGYDGILVYQPCLTDWYERGDAACGEYFLQDLVVAQQVLAANPRVHLDVGSRVDGFVAHIAATRSIEVIDIRPMRSPHSNITMHQADLLGLPDRWHDYCDSVSCLHALEHMGLGRYGDPVSPRGHEAALRKLASVLCPGGVLYLSLPVGRPRVHFNAHRVVDPKALVGLAESIGLRVLRISSITNGPDGAVHGESDVKTLSAMDYALGMFVFRKEVQCT